MHARSAATNGSSSASRRSASSSSSACSASRFCASRGGRGGEPRVADRDEHGRRQRLGGRRAPGVHWQRVSTATRSRGTSTGCGPCPLVAARPREARERSRPGRSRCSSTDARRGLTGSEWYAPRRALGRGSSRARCCSPPPCRDAPPIAPRPAATRRCASADRGRRAAGRVVRDDLRRPRRGADDSVRAGASRVRPRCSCRGGGGRDGGGAARGDGADRRSRARRSPCPRSPSSSTASCSPSCPTRPSASRSRRRS